MADDELKWSEWMKRAQAGDEDSYRRLLQALGVAIESYLRNRFGPLDYLEDIVQESLLAIHQARHTYDADRPFRPWMFAIVRYKAIDMLRKRNVRQNVSAASTDDEQQGLMERQASDDNAEGLLESVELFQRIKPPYRQALILTKVAGLSNREAAGRVGVSEAAMKVRVHRALNELRDLLKPH
jgi:RNA polymerase sigma-70 factor (ECF subfamily)